MNLTPLVIAAALLLPAAALAQEPTAPPQSQPPAQQPPAQQPAQPPTLDDLLGIKPDKPAGDAKAKAPEAQDPTKAALERKLTSQDVTEAFLQAVRLMDETAARLETSK